MPTADEALAKHGEEMCDRDDMVQGSLQDYVPGGCEYRECEMENDLCGMDIDTSEFDALYSMWKRNINNLTDDGQGVRLLGEIARMGSDMLALTGGMWCDSSIPLVFSISYRVLTCRVNDSVSAILRSFHRLSALKSCCLEFRLTFLLGVM